ncbi:GNAT family N-acetyltransferase [Desulfosporosinus sp. PR]|uniref:GNAT family N-acetyltransferase n=1 Tax=Candidatus Desulfosporosinus nitrosoreducens TaxID=3401928 RepID=UPI0027F19185|nr:GNAT family N-acetyltransferase [Desulfosporosinus sp. PR]MDQ7096741.1 GNAT family N-acetyltransferase [Desulfosporosinus sp. PR]
MPKAVTGETKNLSKEVLLLKLQRNKEQYAPLINVVERECHEEAEVIGDSVCLRDKASGTYMIATEKWDELEALLEKGGEKLDTFMITPNNYKPEILGKFPQAVVSEYELYIMQKENYIPYSWAIGDFEVVKLDIDWLDFILRNYNDKEFGNARYISDRIVHGPGLGLLHQGEKAAYLMQHKDGEIGPVFVLPKFRGRGLGSELTKRIHAVLWEKSSVLYAFIEKSNRISAQTIVKSGYAKVKQDILWVYRMKNGTLYLP